MKYNSFSKYLLASDGAVTIKGGGTAVITATVADGTNYTYSGSNVTNSILLNDANKTQTVRFNVRWNDDAATEHMDNATDTSASAEETTSFKVNVNLIQLQ